MEYQSNSHKSKREIMNAAGSDKRMVKKVVTGTVVTKQKGILDTVAQSFFGDSADSVGRYLVTEVFMPALKNTVSEIVSTGIDMLLFGERRGGKSQKNFGHVNYSSVSTAGRRLDTREEPPFRQNKRWQDIILTSREDAEQVLSAMADIVETYNAVCIGDLYDLVGITGDYTDQRFGWTDIGRATVRLTRDGYLLEFPNPIVLD